jgi:hypothetical protein
LNNLEPFRQRRTRLRRGTFNNLDTTTMSWSTKILFLYLGFVALILTLVFTCFGHKTDLEYKDYYSREVNFQEQIDAQKNAEALTQPITYRLESGGVEITFPQELLAGMSGNIELMRPSDASKDLSVSIEADQAGKQRITSLNKGVYKLRVTVDQNHIKYFKEAVINIR